MQKYEPVTLHTFSHLTFYLGQQKLKLLYSSFFFIIYFLHKYSLFSYMDTNTETVSQAEKGRHFSPFLSFLPTRQVK